VLLCVIRSTPNTIKINKATCIKTFTQNIIMFLMRALEFQNMKDEDLRNPNAMKRKIANPCSICQWHLLYFDKEWKQYWQGGLAPFFFFLWWISFHCFKKQKNDIPWPNHGDKFPSMKKLKPCSHWTRFQQHIKNLPSYNKYLTMTRGEKQCKGPIRLLE
jgi:hypothetical protein